MSERPLGWIQKADPRDAQYPMAKVLAAAAPSKRKTRNWWMPAPLDQGLDSFCVGATAEMWLRGDPNRTTDAWRMDAIYWAARERDDLDDLEYPEGTTLRGALKFLQEDGRVGEYLWAQSVEDVVQWVLHRGPVWLGIPWWTGMDTPESDGTIIPDGELRGGHAVLIRGVDTRKGGWFRIRNSWGRWGLKGDAWLHAEYLSWLLAEGEAVGVVEIAR